MHYFDSDPQFTATLVGLTTEQLLHRRAQLERVQDFIVAKNREANRLTYTDAVAMARKRIHSIDVALTELASVGNLGPLGDPAFTPAIERIGARNLALLSHDGLGDDLVLVGGVYMTRAEYQRETAPSPSDADVPS